MSSRLRLVIIVCKVAISAHAEPFVRQVGVEHLLPRAPTQLKSFFLGFNIDFCTANWCRSLKCAYALMEMYFSVPFAHFFASMVV